MPSRNDAHPPTPRPAPIGEAIVARALTILAVTLGALLLVPLVHNAMHGAGLAVALILGQEVAIGVALWFNRIGRTHAGGIVFCSGAWLLAFGLAAFAGEGTRDVVMLALAPILLAAGVLAGRRYLWSLTILTLLALGLLWLAEQRGWIAPDVSTGTTLTALLDAAVILIMTAAATSVITGDLRRTLQAESQNAAALERSELRFRTAIELAADGILLADDLGRVTEANTRLCGLLGLKRGEILGRSLFDLLAPDHESAEARARLERGEIVTGERTLRAATPGEVIVETTWQRLPDRSLQCFVRDITARRRMEEQVRHGQKMEAVGALAGGIAHDFNNLVTVMQGFLELIEADPTLSEELSGHVGELRTASTHAAGLTQQLLAIAGRKPLERRTADVRDLLAANQRQIAGLVGDSIKVVIEPLATPCLVFVDPALITQVLVNLAANAREATPPPRRITLAALSPATHTPPHAGPDGFVIRDFTGIRFSGAGSGIRVSDTGPDVAAGNAVRASGPPASARRAGPDPGLGLAMVHGIIERHGGWVETESAVGRGTTFTLYLPVHAPPEAARRAIDPATLPATAPAATILVVDDDAGMRRLATHVLVQSGYRVIEADSGPEAIQAWDDHSGALDLVFTDMVMPGGMNGLQLIHECRARQAGLPAILTSGYTLPPLGSSHLSPADVVMLSKPYANAVLVDTVRNMIAAHRSAG